MLLILLHVRGPDHDGDLDGAGCDARGGETHVSPLLEALATGAPALSTGVWSAHNSLWVRLYLWIPGGRGPAQRLRHRAGGAAERLWVDRKIDPYSARQPPPASLTFFSSEG